MIIVMKELTKELIIMRIKDFTREMIMKMKEFTKEMIRDKNLLTTEFTREMITKDKILLRIEIENTNRNQVLIDLIKEIVHQVITEE
jgi:hypothetical protein